MKKDEISKLSGQQTTLQQQLVAIESTNFDTGVVNEMRLGVQQIKSLTQSHGLDIDAIQDLQE